MHGATRISSKFVHWNEHKMCANNCLALWIGINWMSFRLAKIQCAYKRQFVPVSSGMHRKRIHRKVIARSSIRKWFTFIRQAHCSIDNQNGLCTTNWYKQLKNICEKWPPSIRNGLSNLRRLSSDSVIQPSSVNSRRINDWNHFTINMKSQTRGVYQEFDDDGIKMHAFAHLTLFRFWWK